MNLGASAIVLRPRTVSEVLDLACRVTFSLALPSYARLAPWALLLPFALLLTVHYALDVPWGWLWAFGIPLVVFLEGPFLVAASRIMFSERLGTREILKVFGRRMASYLGALIIKLFALCLAALPLFIALPIVWPNLLFVSEVTLLEQSKATEAWSRSKRLIMGRSGDGILSLVSWIVVRIAFVFAAEVLFQGVVTDILQLGQPFGKLLDQGGTPYAFFGLFLSSPFIATARFLQYVDTRTRSDGWDIQVRFMAIAAEDELRNVHRGVNA